MVALAKSFVSPLQSCNEVIGSGSCLLVQLVENCGDEPTLYTLTTTVAAAASTVATTITVDLTAISQDGTPITPITGKSVTIREDSILYFTNTNVPVKVLNEIKITAGTPAVIATNAIPSAIGVGSNARTWALELLDTVTDLPINVESSEADRKDLKAGIQGSNVKTRIDLSLDISYFASPLDRTQRSVMLKAALGTQDLYFVAAKSSGLIAFGRAKVMGLQESGDMELTTYSTSLSAQAPFGVTAVTNDPLVNNAEQLVALNAVLEYSGLVRV
jgi:hypothetical protein